MDLKKSREIDKSLEKLINLPYIKKIPFKSKTIFKKIF